MFAAKLRPTPIPITVITGFLGAGKTTLLNRLVHDTDLDKTVVIVNEFGEIGLDHLLIEKLDDDMLLLSAGCVCCTVRGDLIATLENLLRRLDNKRMEPFRRVILETTGLADPAPILQAILYHPYLSMRYAIDGVVTLVDGVHGQSTLNNHLEAVKQVAIADALIITKTDQTEPLALDALQQRVLELAPGVPVLFGNQTAPRARAIMEAGLFGLEGKSFNPRQWLRADEVRESSLKHTQQRTLEDQWLNPTSHYDDRISTFCLISDHPIAAHSLDMFFDLLRSTKGVDLLRIKGLVATKESPETPIVLHGVQHTLHTPMVLPAWPDADKRSRIVFIVKNIEQSYVQALWDAFLGIPSIDQPDATALVDNPLSLAQYHITPK